MPLISVVMPVYNGAKYVRETLDNLLSQSFGDFEVVCVDDSSTDDSYEILEQYAARDARIKVYRKPNERLASLGVQHGLTKATGSYYMYSSQDDLYGGDLLEQYASKISECNPDVVVPNLVCYAGDRTDTSQRNFWRETIPHRENLSGAEAFELSLDWRLHGFCLFRIELVRQVGINTFAYNSDEYTTRKLFLNCNKVVFCDAVFYYRIDNPDAITKKMDAKLYEVFLTNRKLEELALKQKVGHQTLVKLRELALNDVAIRQKFLYSRGKALTKQEYQAAQRLTRQAYQDVQNRGALYGEDTVRRLCFTHGFWLLKFSMWVRSKIDKN